MTALSASDILRIWEAGTGQDPVARALTILAVASPGTPREAWAALPLGRRDAELLALRETTFGPTLESAASCPRCAEPVEFRLEATELRARQAPNPAATEGDLSLPGWSLRYRLPTSGDLAAAAVARDPEEARRALAAHCILEARHEGADVAVEEMPPEAISRMAAAMAEQDPLAEVLVNFACPSCGGEAQMLFDVAAYFWEEIRAHALRLLHEVHVLARAYGWREADILALSAVRRRAYLEMAT
jgi:hypothetical protein